MTKTCTPCVAICWVFSSLMALGSSVGMIVYGVFSQIGGPVYLRNQYVGLWFTSTLLFFALQNIHLLVSIRRRSMPKTVCKKVLVVLNLLYFASATLVSLVTLVFASLAHLIDPAICSVLIALVNILSFVVIASRQFECRRRSLARVQSMEIVGPAQTQMSDNFSSSETMTTTSATVSSVSTRKISKSMSIFFRIFRFLNGILKILFLVILCLLLVGMINEGAGTVRFKPRGKYVTVPLSDSSGRKLKIHYKCDGPKNSGPVFLFEGSASHGMADYFGVQMLLTAKNRRSCIWDKPGLGYSDYLFTDMRANFSLVYDHFIHCIDEQPPYVFVGWGGGGSLVYDFASRYPNMTHSLVFVDVYPAQFEFNAPYTLKNWTQNQLDDYKQQQLVSRNSLFRLINGLGIPLGLMPLFVPPPKSNPPELRQEVAWYFHTAKTWTTQQVFLKQSFVEKNIFESVTIDASIPINLIMSFKTDEQIANQTCRPRRIDSNSPECIYEKKLNAYGIVEREKLSRLTSKGSITYCTNNECNLGYFFYEQPQFTVNALLDLYP